MRAKKQKLPEEFKTRYAARRDELKWLYMELYGQGNENFSEFENLMADYYDKRKSSLKELDRIRETDPAWYQKNDLVGTMMYVDNFAEDLKGVEKKVGYLKKSGFNYIHLMPLLATTEGKSDGGYAVADYRTVEPGLGTMEDLENLTGKCHDENMCVCLDYVMNHTSEDHEWAKRARRGEKEYQDRYFFYDDYSIPSEFEKLVPDVFPKTAPGNFTYLPEINKYVMTTFYPYQWDLNYWNPIVLEEMTGNLLFLANRGIDIIRIDAVPYIWKRLGTNCRNLKEVHTIVRIMRLVIEVVCPGVLLLGEVVMEPKELAPYFGTPQKPECHMLYNATSMCTIWHTVATGDIRLLRHQTDQVLALPKEDTFINYIRCHDDIGWGLDYKFLEQFGMKEVDHKYYLNEYFLGHRPESMSTGELYNADPALGDARFCGTTASMCGIERGGFEGNKDKESRGIALDLMLHAFLMFQSGIPVIYSGDEIGRINDWSYKEDPLKAEDSRYIHRGKYDWDAAKAVTKKGTVPERIYNGLLSLEKIRRSDDIFSSDSDVYTIETHDTAVFGMIRIKGDKKVIGLFNFSGCERQVQICEFSDKYTDMFGKRKTPYEPAVKMAPYEYIWVRLK